MKKFSSWLIVCLLALTLTGCNYFLPYYRVTFDAGEFATYEDVLVMSGSLVDVPTPDVEGQTFLGWYYDEAYEERFYDTDPITKNVTLYARFTPEVVTPAENATYVTASDGLKLTSFTPTSHIVKIPSEYEGQPVVAIGSEVFGAHASEVTVIDLPSSVKVIEDRAFAGCAYLEYLYIPSSVTSLGNAVVAGSSMIKYFELAGNPSLTANAFSDLPFWGMAILAAEGTRADTAVKAQSHSAYPDGPVNYGKLVPDGILAEPVATTQHNAHLATYTDNTRTFAIDEREAGREVVCSEGLLDVVRKGYKPTFADGESAVARLYQQARAVLAQICTDAMTDADKVHAIYDWVTSRTTYAHDVANDIGDSNVNWFNAAYFLEGVFTNGLAVCDGYAKAVELLCTIEGVECVRIVGEHTYGAHAWNKVRINGKYYHLDATHGDVVIAGLEGEVTDHDQLFDAEREGYTPYAPYEDYLATDSTFDYWRYVKTLENMDARIDSTEELAVFIATVKSRLQAGEVVQLWMTTNISNAVNAIQLAINNVGLNAKEYQCFSAGFAGGNKINAPVYIVPSSLVKGAA